ncbi:MAG: type II toxin-antitoxin system death-on-curing family toxin [Planctomycetia bacterium]|nr:type II toxin-antitoxin system death-on-curing family toxin [Planctomycetia bacterium]
MIYLTTTEVLELHARLVIQSGGASGLRDAGLLDSAVAQPMMSFGGQELYPTLGAKAAALGFSLLKNHAFQDGNKRIAHAAMETFLVMNGWVIEAPVDEQEAVILAAAAGQMGRDQFVLWVESHLTPRGG